ncbi:MAG: HEAT repeat domain-containing protein [bacterium]|nr:HEAT repeat domain-containing protein [bacterium]
MLKKIGLFICLTIIVLAGGIEVIAADTKTLVSRGTLDELLPVQNRVRDLLVLLNSARPGEAVEGLKKEVAQGISDLDEAIYAQEKNFDKAEAAKIRQRYAAGEKVWREKVIALTGRDDLPHVSSPVLTPAEKAALYTRYVSLCKGTDPAVRAGGARGIGAVGEKKGVSILLGMLSDEDENVRVTAVISLAWLQAGEAVPVLSRLLRDDKSRWVKRRCAQALGQIGDRSVIPLLQTYIGSSDPYLAENAILSLGWLHAEEAVDDLIKVLKEKRIIFPVFAWQEAVSPSGCAAIALGYIGDTRALEALLDIYQMPYQSTDAEYYVLNLRKSAALGLGLLGDERAVAKINMTGKWPWAVYTMDYSKYAAEMIRQGRKEANSGIRQYEISSHPSFYDFGRNTFMRTLSGFQYPTYPQEKTTETVSGFPAEKTGSQDLPLLYRTAVSTGANMWRYIEAFQPVNSYMGIRERIDYMEKIGLKTQIFVDFNGGSSKPDFMRMFVLYGDLPAWQGVDQEELEFSLTRAWHSGGKVDIKLREYLSDKYSPNELQSLGIDLSAIKTLPLEKGHTCPPGFSSVLFSEYNEMKDEAYLEFFKEHTQFIHCLRRGTDCRYSFSQSYASGYPGRYWELADIVDGCGPENADRQVDGTATFWAELSRNGEPRSSTVFWWPGLSKGWTPSDEEYVDKGFASSLAHTQGVILWGAEFYLPWALSVKEKPVKYYRNDKMELIAAYMKLAQRIEPYLTQTRIATPVALIYSERTGKSPFYCDIDSSAYHNAYSNMQMGIWRKLTEAHLPIEPVICETISPKKLAPYKLVVLANGRVLSEEEENTIREFVRQGGTLLADASTTLYDRWSRQRRDYGLSDVFGLSFNGLSANNDAVKDIKGKVMARCDNGDPELTLHRYGKGMCIFSTRSLEKREPRMWQELIASILKSMNVSLPVEVENCPADIDVVPRRQPNKDRLIVHLINWRKEEAKGIVLKLNKVDKVKVFYAADDREIVPESKDGRLIIPIRDFKTYEIVVIEKQ